ncbi:unnamed protein product [Adineta steineri]|uniref:Nipped-B protein n=1 Tax=Adineta steineri TaxID=433720 RepID=A0A813NRQ4_9BILA|nr:unnamed protein product [Adineta steineri]
MKHKTSKRSNSNKYPQNNISLQVQTRRLSDSSTGANDLRAKSLTNKPPDGSTGTDCFDSNTLCFKSNLELKSQKVLKRDLLRCSDQPPSLLGSHTLHTPGIHHGSQQMHALTLVSNSSSINHGQSMRRRSFSADPHLSHITHDRLGPWPDIGINRVASAGNELNPMKNCRTMKNSRAFSPKYFTALNDNTSKFKYHSSSETYIDEYRKQKGYFLDLNTIKFLSRSFLLQQQQQQQQQKSDEEKLPSTDTLNNGIKTNNDISADRIIVEETDRKIAPATDRLTASTTDLSAKSNLLSKSSNNMFEHMVVPPSIPTFSKVYHESHQISSFPALSLRHPHLRSIRHSNQNNAAIQQSQQQQQQQTVSLPPLSSSSLQFISGINSADRFYSNNRKPSIQNHSKLFLFDGRHKKRISQRTINDSEVATGSPDYSELRATGCPVVTTTQRTTALAGYQVPRPPPTFVTSQILLHKQYFGKEILFIMDLPSINLITGAPLNDVIRELPVLSLANPGMERIVDSSTAEYTSMLLNCRDGSLAQQLAHKLSIVANTATSITLRQSSDPAPPPIHALPPLLQTTTQYNPNIFNAVCHPPSSFSRPFQSPTNPYPHYTNPHFPQQISPTNNGYSQTTASASPYSSRGFMPATTATTPPVTNQSPDCQSMIYPQTPTLPPHRPTRPTAVVPPLPKDPIITSPMGSTPSTSSSMTPSSISNYQQVSPQKPPNYQKQTDSLPSNEFTNKMSPSVTNNNIIDNMTKKSSPAIPQEQQPILPPPPPHQQVEKVRINLQKLQHDQLASIRNASPSKQRSIKPNIPQQQLNHLPSDFTPDLIKELLQDGYSLDNNSSERPLRQCRSSNSNTTSLNNSPKKKRIRSSSTDDDDDDDDNDNYNDDGNNIDNNNEEHQPLKKRIRRTNDTSLNNNPIDVMSALNKKTRDRLARKALDIDADPQENTSYQRFIQLLDIFNDDYERHHEQIEQTPDDHYLDLLLSDHTLDEMAILSEKLKLSTYMSRIDRVKLKRLLEILSLRIKQGVEISPILKHDINDEQTDEEEERIWRDLVFERLTMCANACEISLNIMTTDHMPKEILIEHVIEHTALFIKAQLAKTIFPEYDPLYRNDNHSKDPSLTKQKRSKVTGTKCKQVQILYNKIVSLFQGITDLMPLGKYPDTIILAISSFTVSCIYVENIVDIQAHSLRILTELFSRYEHHRDSILEDILLSIARLPTSKKSLRCYRLPSGESIQMFTALIMHLIHAPVTLASTNNINNIIDSTNEIHLLNTYTTAQNLAFKFLTLFFRSCGTKQGEDDYRIVFENFLADLLVTANRPEWPASEILLTLLSRILMTNFSNHSLPINTRLQSLDYLGSVAAQLRKDTIDNDVLNSKENQDRLDHIVHKTLTSIEMDEDVMDVYKTDPLRYHRSLVIYLNELSLSDQTSHFAKMFHIGQWLRDLNLTVERLTQTLTRRMKPGQAELVDDDVDESMNTDSKPSISIEDEIEMKKNEKISILKMLSLPETARKQQRYTLDIEYDDICLLMRYLTSNRPFLKTFDVYLKQLAAIFQSEAGTNIRSKAMKCLCTVVEADPTVLARNDIKSCVKVGLTDKSISVREAAIDLIGRYIVQKQELILQYYDVLCERSIDTGVSVRKRVVKIFRDVCLTQPSFSRTPDICSRLLRRIHDEESIRKLVLETFQQLWFSPIRNQQDVRQRVQTIIDVLVDAQKQNYTWLENLVKEFLQTNDKQSNDDKKKVREQRKDVLKAIQDIINELVESILKIESASDQVSSNKMVAIFIALYALGKAKPEHVLPHVSTIVEYLNIKCTSYNDNIIVQYVAKILEFTVPLMKSASSSIIYSLEGSLTKLLLVSGQLVIHSSIACLSAVIRLSKNTQLVKDVFIRYHSIVIQCQQKILEKPDEEFKGSAQLARSIYILGVLCKYFDIEKNEFDDLEFSVDDIFQLFIFFIRRPESVVKLKSLVGLGFFLQRYGQYLIRETIRQLYHTYLLDRRPAAAQLRCQVLINLEEYFRDCIRRMSEQDVDYLHLTATTINPSTTITTNDDENSNDASGPTGPNLKDTTDMHSEMASSIAQCYLRVVLDTYLSEDETIRQCVRKVVTCILEQGLVHPVQFIPYLIAMTTDRDTNIQQSAEQNLQDLDKTNPGIIQTKVMHGLKMSYQLQKLLAIENNNKNTEQSNVQFDIIRGMTKVAVTPTNNQQFPYCSVNHFLYSLIRSSRVYRRGLISQLLKMFDNDATTTTSTTLEEQLFVADNLAYFPYQVQDEPLYLIEQIDLTISVSGSTQLQQFRDLLKQYLDYIDDDEGIDINKFEEKFLTLSDTIIDELNQCLRTSKSTMLLLILKSYLKDIYSLNDAKITEYDHTESSKVTDRPIISRKMHIKFEPKIILDTITPSNHMDSIQRRKQILKDFQDFKRYLLAFDTDTDDTVQSISDLLPSTTTTTSSSSTTTPLPSKSKKKSGGTNKRRKVMIDSEDDSADGNFQP